MKANPSVQRRGVALVIVLVFVVLLSVFILSFFTNSQNELSAAQSFSGEISAHQLAENASAVVMGQIREATTRENVAWASQPGMIRTYGDSAGGKMSEKADAFFKLYSSDDMIIGRNEMSEFISKLSDTKSIGAEFPIDADPDGKTGWDSQPALYTDINSPITLADPPPGAEADSTATVVKFPIIDGHDIKKITLPAIPAVPKTEPSKTVLTYDALDDKGARNPDGVPDIEGFAIDPATVKYDPNAELSPTNTPVPMPVRWLYVLRDGTLSAPRESQPDETSKLMTRAVWDETTKVRPTKDNPIVGRVAFWTDDDTCKVNINTAGGFNFKDVDRGKYKTERAYAGSYWDQPRTFTRFDYGEAMDDNRNKGEDGTVIRGGLSITQPVAKEYQRYPGHPMTTSLGLLFKDLLNSEQLYSVLPRLVNKGTRGGAERFYADKSDLDDLPEGVDEQEITTPLTPKRDRLFASVDEFLFSPRTDAENEFRSMNDTRLRKNTNLIDKRASNSYNDQLPAGKDAITPEILERMRFFLTAHSRAPELNLFGRPRVTIWPSYPEAENTNPLESRLNASDRLLNFCSIIGPRTRPDGASIPTEELKLFQFQRSDPYSPTNDWDGTKPTPGRIVMPRTSGGQTRNQFIYKYLQELTDKPVPGFAGASFRDKYTPADRDQILTTIFDYMRCVNMRDSTRDKMLSPDNPKDPVAAIYPKVEKYKFAPLGVVVPIQIKTESANTRGFGRFPTISEASLVIYHTGYGTTAFGGSGPRGGGGVRFFRSLNKMNAALAANNPPIPAQGKEKVNYNYISAFLVFETFNPMMGYAPTRTLSTKSADRVRYVMEIKGLDGFKVMAAGSPELLNGDGDLRFPSSGVNYFNSTSGSYWHGRNLGGTEGYMHLLVGNWNEASKVWVPHKFGVVPSKNPQDHYYQFQGNTEPGVGVKAPVKPEPALGDANYYKWHNFSDGVQATWPWQKIRIAGATLDVTVRFGNQGSSMNSTDEPVVRKLTMVFPETTVPMPTDLTWSDPGGFFPHPADEDVAKDLTKGANGRWACSPDPGISPAVKINPEGVKRFGDRLWAYTGAKTTENWNARKAEKWGGCVDPEGGNNNSGAEKPGLNSTNRWRQLIQPGDTVRSLVVTVDGGDPRIAAINDEQSREHLLPHPDYSNQNVRHAQTLRTAAGPAYITGVAPNATAATIAAAGRLGYNDAAINYFATTKFGKLATIGTNLYAADRYPDVPPNITDGVKMSFGKPVKAGLPGDFDTGLGNIPDGAFTGKADEGNPVFRRKETYTAADGSKVEYWVYPHPYFNYDYEETFDTFFTPNRQTPSAVVFGSLPLGKNGHWTTLAFSPFSACESADKSGKTLHPGRKAGFVRDHLLLDLFNMPIVEPYAISEPFSTAGKVNMNYPMMPFANIERSTAFRAALHSVRVSAFPAIDSAVYKAQAAFDRDYNYRYPVNRDMTIRAFRDFFDKFKNDQNEGLFKSATEICDRGLYPLETTSEVVRAGGPIKYTAPSYTKPPDPDFYLKTQFWNSNSMTGDNMREKPYSDLYPRLTTKSNTYTVHVRAQSLRQTTLSAEKGIWDEKKDRVIGEYRGSSTIERFIDPEDARFDPNNETVDPKDKINVDKDPLEKAYRFRVISTKRFVP